MGVIFKKNMKSGKFDPDQNSFKTLLNSIYSLAPIAW